MAATAAGSTTGSSTDPTKVGALARLLVPGAAHPSTKIEQQQYDAVLVALTAVAVGLLKYTMSGDALWLSLASAEQSAARSGVSPETFSHVRRTVVGEWRKQMSTNPLASMFEQELIDGEDNTRGSAAGAAGNALHG